MLDALGIEHRKEIERFDAMHAQTSLTLACIHRGKNKAAPKLRQFLQFTRKPKPKPADLMAKFMGIFGAAGIIDKRKK